MRAAACWGAAAAAAAAVRSARGLRRLSYVIGVLAAALALEAALPSRTPLPPRPSQPGTGPDFYGLWLPAGPPWETEWLPQHVEYDYEPPAPSGADPLPPEYRPPQGRPAAFAYTPVHPRLGILLSQRPRVIYYPRLLTDDECDTAVALARQQTYRSTVAVYDAAGAAAENSRVSEARTSRGAWLDIDAGPLASVALRLGNVTGLEWHERMQVLHYGRGEHYDAHTDYFDPRLYAEQGSNRAATVLIALSTTPRGGATTFPRAGGQPVPPNWRDKACDRGLRIRPRKGAAVLFYGMRADWSLDPHSLHGGCDVEEGEKWIAALWWRVTVPPGVARVM
eukprot:TRINITY_DN26313_c1_g1_i1.p1 TRINITY_DN26313_c1_g1~~TRINITY_DN26313_c1_g1_i1.p1  ORF type:complete len:364 (+),score=61.41 TRINITY_DN26313_c1_g1_i1:83-1093(+)